MTPKEKAKELYIEMLKWQDDSNIYLQREISNISAKKCALIAVDEILKEYAVLQIETSFCYKQYLYWEQVKKEIDKL